MQAPHSPRPQTSFVPVSCEPSRSVDEKRLVAGDGDVVRGSVDDETHGTILGSYRFESQDYPRDACPTSSPKPALAPRIAPASTCARSTASMKGPTSCSFIRTSASTAGRASRSVPVTAIFPEEDVPGNMQQYIQINRDVFKCDAPPGKPQK